MLPFDGCRALFAELLRSEPKPLITSDLLQLTRLFLPKSRRIMSVPGFVSYFPDSGPFGILFRKNRAQMRRFFGVFC
jgi:hypothetical protein